MAAASPRKLPNTNSPISTNALRYVRVEHTALEHVKYNHPILRCVWTNPIDPLRRSEWIALLLMDTFGQLTMQFGFVLNASPLLWIARTPLIVLISLLEPLKSYLRWTRDPPHRSECFRVLCWASFWSLAAALLVFCGLEVVLHLGSYADKTNENRSPVQLVAVLKWWAIGWLIAQTLQLLLHTCCFLCCCRTALCSWCVCNFYTELEVIADDGEIGVGGGISSSDDAGKQSRRRYRDDQKETDGKRWAHPEDVGSNECQNNVHFCCPKCRRDGYLEICCCIF